MAASAQPAAAPAIAVDLRLGQPGPGHDVVHTNQPAAAPAAPPMAANFTRCAVFAVVQ